MSVLSFSGGKEAKHKQEIPVLDIDDRQEHLLVLNEPHPIHWLEELAHHIIKIARKEGGLLSIVVLDNCTLQITGYYLPVHLL